jgi:hypothetical protein
MHETAAPECVACLLFHSQLNFKASKASRRLFFTEKREKHSRKPLVACGPKHTMHYVDSSMLVAKCPRIKISVQELDFEI